MTYVRCHIYEEEIHLGIRQPVAMTVLTLSKLTRYMCRRGQTAVLLRLTKRELFEEPADP